EAYCAAMQAGDFRIRHGFALDDDEQRRRHVILSLLCDGVEACDLFAEEWRLLQDEGCVERVADRDRLTRGGVKHAGVMCQESFSERVRRLSGEFEYDR